MSGNIQILGSIEAVRPVFMIVMGAFMALIAWRLARSSGVWAARCLVTGSLLLGFGYSFLMPLYAAGVLRQYAPGIQYHGDTGSVLAWHVVKLVVMNSGWLFFGIGLALHANLLQPFAASPRKQPRRISPHESVA